VKKILAYRFSAFGDVAMIVPVLKEFLAQNPDTEIVFVSRKNFADLFDGVERLTFRGVNLDDYKGFFGLRKLALELKKVTASLVAIRYIQENNLLSPLKFFRY
jgi:ADP-heptose:LPS heptosyltransferase